MRTKQPNMPGTLGHLRLCLFCSFIDSNVGM